jgi:hypothetical protein
MTLLPASRYEDEHGYPSEVSGRPLRWRCTGSEHYETVCLNRPCPACSGHVHLDIKAAGTRLKTADTSFPWHPIVSKIRTDDP